MNEIMNFIDLGAIVVSVVGAYFYIKFKVAELEKSLNDHKLTHKEELITLRASKMSLKREIQERYDEKIADLKEQQAAVNTAIEKRLDSIDSKLDKLLMR